MTAINAQEFKQAAVFASKDKCRPTLAAVLVEVEGDDYRLVATDAYRLIGFEYGYPMRDVTSYVVDASEASNIKTSDVLIELVNFEEDARLLEVRITDKKGKVRTEYWNTVEGKYANWRQLIPNNFEDEGSQFKVNPTYLKDACSVIDKVYGKNTPIKVYPTKPNKPIFFEASEKDKARCFGLIMPVFDPSAKKAPSKANIVHVEQDIEQGLVSQLPEDSKKALLHEAYCSLLMKDVELEDAILEIVEKVATAKVSDLGNLVDVEKYAA